MSEMENNFTNNHPNQDNQNIKYPQDNQNIQNTRNIQDIQNTQEIQNLQEIQNTQEIDTNNEVQGDGVLPEDKDSVSETEKELERLKNEYVGNILDDRYEILDVVGKGGMACVLKAHDMTMNRIVAIKILDSELNEDEGAVERFKNESQAIAMMSHKNIVTVYDVVCHEDMKYIIMEFLHGITFEKYLSRKGKLQWKEACYFMYKILGALEHSHSKGIIHSDVKPQNMMIDKDGEIILTDFGIACIPSNLSDDGEIRKDALGTAIYMSPEQAQGKPVCEQSDIYSVGVILYETVAGRLPFEDADPYVVMQKHISETAVSPASYTDDIPDGLVQIITKAMRKNADERYPTAREMADAIEEISKNPKKTFDGIEIPDIALVDDTTSKEIKKKRRAEVRRKKREARMEAKLSSPVSRSFFPIITGVALAFIIVCEAAVGYSLWNVLKRINVASTLETIFYTDDDVQVTIPSLVNKKWSDVKSQLEAGELKDNKGNVIYVDPEGITSEFNSKYEAGTIIQQDPAPNMQAKDNVISSLVISLGSPSSYMPNVVYMSLSDAETSIRSIIGDEIKIEVVDVDHEFANPNQVVKTEPEAGQLISGISSIKLHVVKSVSATDVRMPDIVGKSFEEAKKILQKYGIGVGNVDQVNSLKDDSIVLSQSIKAYETVTPGIKVNLTVSKKVDTLPMINVVGTKVDEAKKTLANFGLKNVKVEYAYTSGEDGIVLQQSVLAGETVSANTYVVITVNVHADTKKVPNIVGKTVEEASAILVAEGIDFQQNPKKSFHESGIVISQNVAPGTEVIKGQSVLFTYSEKVETLEMKKLIGLSPEEAINWLKECGISYNVSDAIDPTITPGLICMQSVPLYSTITSDVSVTIYVNKYVPVQDDTNSGAPLE